MKCAIYCRISRDEGADGENESIQNQREILTQYAARQGWSVEAVYTDEDVSGADSHRPGFERLLHDAEAGLFQIILCKTQSRFTRDMETVERVLHGLLQRWNVRFISVADNADTSRRDNKKARQITGLVNEWYLEDLSDSIRLVLDHKRKAGRFIGSFAPYGYVRSAEEKGLLIPDPEAAAVVKRIFLLAAEGLGAQRIAEVLNREGVPNPSAYKKRCGLQYRNPPRGSGERWSRSTVSRILQNEVYLGVLLQGKRRKESYKSSRMITVRKEEWYRVEGTHTPLVDHALFLAANRFRRDRSMRCGPIHQSEPPSAEANPVQGVRVP